MERVIGIQKRRFRVLRLCMDFEMLMVKMVIFACIATHNFIRDYDANDLGEDFARTRRKARTDRAVNARSDVITIEFSSAENWRSLMADAMWAEFQPVDDADVLVDDIEEEYIDRDSCSDSD